MFDFARALGGLSAAALLVSAITISASPWWLDADAPSVGPNNETPLDPVDTESVAPLDPVAQQALAEDLVALEPRAIGTALSRIPSEATSTMAAERASLLVISYSDTTAKTTTSMQPVASTTSVPVASTTSVPVASTTSVPVASTTSVPAAPDSRSTHDLTSSGPITVTESGTVIENVHFTGSGSASCVRISGASNVTVRNSRFTNCYKGIYAVNSSNVIVTNNEFEADLSGRGRNAVQFDKVSGGYVAGNRSTVEIGATEAEDHISMYKSNGSASNPIVIEGNILIGGGPSRSGSGIMLGDNGGSWQVARNNILQDPGQVGIGVSGGTNITVVGNIVSSSSHPWTNVGIYAWDWNGSGCSNVTITNNNVPEWAHADGHLYVFWDGGNCSNLTVTDNSWQNQSDQDPVG